MKSIVTVIGEDRIGIIAAVCTELARLKVNILDISQTVMQTYFTMTMLVDISRCDRSFGELSDALTELGGREGLSIRIQREDIFKAANRI
ncbi:MAG: ACT domain-containing protein [Oscillospiraceae bacterium]|jgi:ACT domain-containing protein|nr:ACT domain-containing protein [Oscillospiraceae bacterium]